MSALTVCHRKDIRRSPGHRGIVTAGPLRENQRVTGIHHIEKARGKRNSITPSEIRRKIKFHVETLVHIDCHIVAKSETGIVLTFDDTVLIEIAEGCVIADFARCGIERKRMAVGESVSVENFLLPFGYRI